MRVAILFLFIFGAVTADLHSDYLQKERSLKEAFENAMDKKIRSMAEGDADVEEALAGLKKRYVEAFNHALKHRRRQVRQALMNPSYASHENVRRSFGEMSRDVHDQASLGYNIWDNIVDKFNSFGDWARGVLGDLWSELKPSLIEVRDLAVKLVKDGARQLSEKAKEEAKKFFTENAEKLTNALKEQISKTLSTTKTLPTSAPEKLQKRDVWGSIKEKFNDFGDWAKQFFIDVWAEIEPSLIEVRDMASKLIVDKAKELTAHAKEQAMKFFQAHADKLTDDMKAKVTDVLGTGDKTAVSVQERDIWGSIKDKFNDFGDWAKQFLVDIWSNVEPSLIEVRDMARQLIVEKASQLTAHAKEQAMKFFQMNGDKLTNELKDKIDNVLGTGQEGAVEVQARGISEIWGSIKEKFNDFGEWTKQFFGDVWGQIEPSLIEVRDMARQLIVEKASQLTAHAKEQAMKFFQINGDKLTNELKDKLTNVLGTGQEETVEIQERGISEIWGSIKDKFNDFGEWTKQFLGDVWGEIEPGLIEVRDMARELIVDKASQLTAHAKEQAMKFFQQNADKLTSDMKDKLTNVLGTGEQAA